MLRFRVVHSLKPSNSYHELSYGKLFGHFFLIFSTSKNVQYPVHYLHWNKITEMLWRSKMIKIQKLKSQSNRFYYFTNISAWGYLDRNQAFGVAIFGILLVLVSLINVTHELMSHFHVSYIPFHPLLLSKSFLVAYSSCAFMDIDLHFILG